MANSTEQAIKLALEGLKTLKIEVASLNKQLLEGASTLHAMLNTDATSFKKIQELTNALNTATKKLNETSENKIVVDGKIKVKQNELAESIKSLNAQKQKEESSNQKLLKSTSKIAEEINKKIKLTKEEEKQTKLKIVADKKAAAQVKANNALIAKQYKEGLELQRLIAKEEKAISDKKIARERALSKQMSNRMTESVNAIGKQSDAIKKLNSDYAKWEKSSASAYKKEQAAIKTNDAARKKANTARLQEADRIERNKQALLKQKAASLELSRAYVQLVAKQKQAKKVLEDSMVSKGKDNALTKEAKANYDSLTSKINKANAATSNFAKKGLKSSLTGIRNLLGAFGLIGGIQIFANLIKDAFRLTTALDSIGFSMRAVITDTEELGQTQIWLKQITKDYGAELVTTTNRYIKFRAAAKQAGMSAKETQEIFGTMTKAAGVLGLKTDELTGVYLALEQMISKGKITTEELRRQLGERLPGAMDIMATSMGVTTSELDKMLRAGEVITKDVLPAFARQVEISFGLDKVEKVTTLRAAITRLKNSWTVLVDDFAKGGTQIKSLTGLLDHFSDNLNTYVKAIVLGAKAFLWYKTMVIASSVQTKVFSAISTLSALKMRLLGTATLSTTKKVILFNNAMKANVLGIIVTLLYAAYEAFEYFNKPLGEATKLMKEQTEELKAQTTSYVENRDEVNKMANAYEDLVKKGLERTNEETAEMERLFIALAKVAPIVITKTDEFGVATEISTGKLKDFNKEMKQSLLDKSSVVLKNQSTELKKYTILQKDLIKFEKERIAIRHDELGEVIKRNGVYKRYSKWQKKFIDLTLEEKSVLSDYKLEVRDGIIDSKKTIATNEDLIGTITGVLTVRQLEAKALRDKKIADEKEEKELEGKKIAYVELITNLKSYKKQLKDLGDPKLLKTKDLEHFNELQKSISDTESAITKLTGETDKVSGSSIKYIKGSIAYYEKQISIAKESIQNSTLSKEGYDKQTEAIEKAEEAIKKLKTTFLGLKERGFLELKSKGLDKSIFDGINDVDIPEIEIPFKFTEEGKAIDALVKKILKLETLKDVFGTVTDTFSEIFDIDMSKFDFLFDSATNSIEDWAEVSKELIGSVLDASLARYDVELQEAARVRDITLNNDLATDEAKENARDKYDKKEADIKNRQAKEERRNTLIKIAMDTAVGVAKAHAAYLSNPLTAPALPFILPLIIGTGLAQAAIVASQPLPKFEKGVEGSTYEGLAIKDEKGAELHYDKKGNIKDFGQNKGAKHTYVERGDTILNASKTKELLGGFGEENLQRVIFDMNMQGNGNILSEKSVDRSLHRELQGLRSDFDSLGKEMKRISKRPINVNNKVEVKTEKPY